MGLSTHFGVFWVIVVLFVPVSFIFYLCGSCGLCVFWYVYYVYMGQVPEIKLMMMMIRWTQLKVSEGTSLQAAGRDRILVGACDKLFVYVY